MTKERLKEIFDNTKSKWEGGNAFKGMQILAKFTTYILRAAEHDEIFCGDIEECLKNGMTEADATELAKLNWGIDDWETGFRCAV